MTLCLETSSCIDWISSPYWSLLALVEIFNGLCVEKSSEETGDVAIRSQR
jgi:hypothetical protein